MSLQMWTVLANFVEPCFGWFDLQQDLASFYLVVTIDSENIWNNLAVQTWLRIKKKSTRCQERKLFRYKNYTGRFKFRRTLKPTLCSLVYSDLTLEEVETFFPSFEEPSEGSNKQNKTKRTEIAAFISRKINRSRVRIENPTLKHNCCGSYFQAHRQRL